MPTRDGAPLHSLAKDLNGRLERVAPEILAMLSGLGRRLYFPKGILSQSAEAKQKAHRFNATIGIATEGHEAMFLPSMGRQLVDIGSDDAFDYAPGGGRPSLRALWREKLLKENPSLRERRFGLPIVTSALTHGLSLVGDLFVDPGDRLLLPDKLWGNYRLLYEIRLGAEVATFPFYAGSGFNVEGFAEALEREASGRSKLIVLLNFPNNPTGYMPTAAEGNDIAGALRLQAERGTQLVVVIDDAYFGLFHHVGGESLTESLFGFLANCHPNLLAVKLDGATKELFAWGLRCGFITFGPGRADAVDEATAVLDAKVRGSIRSVVSSSPHLSQTMVERALASPSLPEERKQKAELLGARAKRVHEVANSPRYRESWDVYPFNSGYFMCLAVKGVDAERLRVHLLDAHGAGLIATGSTDLRVAFSCLELDEVEPLFEAVHQGVQELRDR